VNARTVCQEPLPRSRPWIIILAGAVIVGAALVSYKNSYRVPFLFDDVESIVENPTIRHLWPIGPVLSPPRTRGFTVAGRPLVNVSLAVNYALGGTAGWGYHVVNLTIHILAGLTLFGIVRRTLHCPVLRGRFAGSATTLALATAILWMLHPLQTEAVTYVVQRTESLMGLFYLLTLYCFLRATESPSPRLWLACSVVACALGMATKEVAVTAPLMVLLYDRTFVGGEFAEAWRRRRRFYAWLGCTWLIVGWLALRTSGRGGTAGFGTEILWWQYALTQCWAISRYLWLSVWPRGLVFDYGILLYRHAAEVMPQILLLAGLLTATAVALVYRPRLGFLGAWFFVILAPSSSFFPVASQTIAEHRLYLPLAGVVTLVVMGIHKLLGKSSMAVYVALAAALGLLTLQRNHDYRSKWAIWTDTVTKCPNNARAQNNLCDVLTTLGRPTEAVAHCEQALRSEPDYAEAYNNLGVAFEQMGKPQEAAKYYAQALQLKSDYPEAHYNLGVALIELGDLKEAVGHFRQALRPKPEDVDTHYNLGVALLGLGRASEAATHFEKVLLQKPHDADAHYSLALALVQQRKLVEATEHFEQTLEIRPDFADAHNNLGVALLRQGKPAEAIGHFEQAIHLSPNNAEAYNNLGAALEKTGRIREAIQSYEQALRVKPDDAAAQSNLARARAAR